MSKLGAAQRAAQRLLRDPCQQDSGLPEDPSGIARGAEKAAGGGRDGPDAHGRSAGTIAASTLAMRVKLRVWELRTLQGGFSSYLLLLRKQAWI